MNHRVNISWRFYRKPYDNKSGTDTNPLPIRFRYIVFCDVCFATGNSRDLVVMPSVQSCYIFVMQLLPLILSHGQTAPGTRA